VTSTSTLAERLGHDPSTTLLIFSVDGLGTSHASTTACYTALRGGLASSADLHVPCPWARHAAASYKGEDVGVALTTIAELEQLRWGPITWAPSLLDGDGGFPRTVEDLWDHADVDEVRRECRAQVERAALWGIDVTHLSVHLDALLLRPEFSDVVLELAAEERLPVRLPTDAVLAGTGFPLRDLAAAEGIVSPDRVVRAGHGRSSRAVLLALLEERPPGVTELVLQPALDTAELRAITPDCAGQVDDLDLVANDGAIATLVAQAGVVVTGYRALRDLMT
jgi:predicted glycoside hydrolase/deacetylase ChbG (UPF0249 family)